MAHLHRDGNTLKVFPFPPNRVFAGFPHSIGKINSFAEAIATPWSESPPASNWLRTIEGHSQDCSPFNPKRRRVYNDQPRGWPSIEFLSDSVVELEVKTCDAASRGEDQRPNLQRSLKA